MGKKIMRPKIRRVRMDLEYIGKQYCGWQYQKNGVSVQQKIEEAISIVTNQQSRVIASGRTDAGAHAINQVAHVDLVTDITDHDLANALSTVLPNDISVICASTVADSWHARFSALTKTYQYRVLNQRSKSAFYHGSTWHIKRPLNMERIQNSADLLIGEHDFTAFQSAGRPVYSAVRNIIKLSVTNEPPLVIFEVTANGFLKQIVRNIVGTLVDISNERFEPNWIDKLFHCRDRKLAGQCAPAEGLYLLKVEY